MTLSAEFEGRVALVTGASRGIGFAIAEKLAVNGATVIAVARNAENLSRAVEQINDQGGHAVGFAADSQAPRFVEEIQGSIGRNFGPVDILVNNAGGPPMARLLETTPEIWTDAVNTHLFGVIQLTKSLLPGMLKGRFGRILTISSSVVIEPSPEMIVSGTVRAGIHSFSKAVGTEFARYNVSANVILPGGVWTERMEQLVLEKAARGNRDFNEVLEEIEASIPAGRFAEPSEIAGLAMFLCSESAGYITGQSIVIDGGLTKSY